VTLINWLLKPKCMLILIFEFLLYENMIWFFFRYLAVCLKTKNIIYFFQCFDKTGYFNTGFVSLQYKNTNQYQEKFSRKIWGKITYFFEIILKKISFHQVRLSSIHVAGLDPAGPAVSLAQASDPLAEGLGTHEFVSRVHQPCEGN